MTAESCDWIDYETWMEAVDRIFLLKIGMTSGDLRDRLWRDSYDSGATPEEAILELCGDPDDIEEFYRQEIVG